MKLTLRSLAASSCLALAACGSSAPPEAPRAEDRRLERAVQEPLDKARAVEEQMQKQKEAQDAKLREQEG
jgi:hypothetical protein